MAADTGKIFACLGATLGGSPIVGAGHGRIRLKTYAHEDAKAKGNVVGKQRVEVEVYVDSPGIYNLVSFQHPTTPIVGATHARIIIETKEGEDALLENIVKTDFDVKVELFGNNPRALFVLIGTTVANGVLNVLGPAGAAVAHTIKNLHFTEAIAEVDIPSRADGRKLAAAGIRGTCEYLPGTDTMATCWTCATSNARDLAVLLDSAAAATLIYSVLRDDGSTGTETLLAVKLTKVLGNCEIPEADGTGRVSNAFGLGGICTGVTAVSVKWVSA